MSQTQAQMVQNAQAQNLAIRAAVLNIAQDMKQSIFSGTVVPATNGNVIRIPLRQVGLVKGFIVEVDATIQNTGATDNLVLTAHNIANVLSNISFFDLDNYQRINTTGWHVGMLNTAKEAFPFGAAILNPSMDCPVNYGNNFDVLTGAAAIAPGATGSVKMRYYVPLAYSKNDLRGAVYMGVVNASAYLELTLNPAPAVVSGVNSPYGVYSGNTGIITSANVNVYQCYLDQLPRWQGGKGAPPAGTPMLPPLDVATQYRLVNTALTGVSAQQDFPIPFSNFQDFLSLSMIYNRGGALGDGSDLNYFALAAANTLQLFKLAPLTQALLSRVRNRVDWPAGTYMFDFRDAPVSTNQTGNIQLLLNAVTAPADTVVAAGFESFAMVNTVLGAASLPAG